MAQKKKKGPGGKRTGAGRPTRKDLGLDPTKTVTLRVETNIIELAKKTHGSLSNAIRASVGF